MNDTGEYDDQDAQAQDVESLDTEHQDNEQQPDSNYWMVAKPLKAALREIENKNYEQAEIHLNKAHVYYGYLDDYQLLSQNSLREERVKTANLEAHIEQSKSEQYQLRQSLDQVGKLLERRMRTSQPTKSYTREDKSNNLEYGLEI